MCIVPLPPDANPIAVNKYINIKNSNDTMRNRTRDLSVCSAVPQLTAPKEKVAAN